MSGTESLVGQSSIDTFVGLVFAVLLSSSFIVIVVADVVVAIDNTLTFVQ